MPSEGDVGNGSGRVIRDGTPGELIGWFESHWGGRTIVVHGTTYRAEEVASLVAEDGGVPVGVLSYVVEGDALEVVSIDATRRRQGTGAALVAAAIDRATQLGLRRIWCTTTNDNLPALAFWQRQGLCLAAVRPDAVRDSRRVKPAIPMMGESGLPIRDELDLELLLA